MPRKVSKPQKKSTDKIKTSESVDLNEPLVSDLSEEEYLIDEGELSLDILEDAKKIYIESPVAGVDVKDINIDIEQNKITIQGVRKNKLEKNKKYIYRECFYGRFSRSIILPTDIIQEKTTAKIEDGILKIILTKR